MSEPGCRSAPATFEKVSVFVVREAVGGHELLTFLHPTAGRQIPAGSVEPGEAPADAAAREVLEETGVAALEAISRLGETIEELGRDAVALRDVRLVDVDAEVVGLVERGHRVRIEHVDGGRVLVSQRLLDHRSEPPRDIPGLRGWAAGSDFAMRLRRSFWVARAANDGRRAWPREADGHVFRVAWVPLSVDLRLVPGQSAWLRDHAAGIRTHLAEVGRRAGRGAPAE